MPRSEESKKKQLEYGKRYDAKNKVNCGMRLSKIYDADIIEWLKQFPSRQGYIKELIREDMKNKGYR